MGLLIAVDIDDTICAGLERWTSLYRKDWNHELYAEDITDWDISLFVKPECGKSIYEYLYIPEYYKEVEPIEGALENIEYLRDLGHEIVFVTSTGVHDNGRKFDWLVEHGFLDGSRESEKSYVECRRKSLIRASALVDDYIGNLKDFKGWRILFDRPHNQNDTQNYNQRAYDWEGVVKSIKNLEEGLQWVSGH